MVLGKRFTPEQKAEAIRLYAEYGGIEAAKRTGVSARSVEIWAKAAGIKGPGKLDQAEIESRAQELATQVVAATQGAPTAADVADAVLTLEQKAKLKRGLIRQDLLDTIHDMIKRMYEAHLEFFPIKDDVLQRTYPKAPHSAVRNYAVAFATLFKEYRLEAGEATDRPEVTQRLLDFVKDDHERDLLRKAIDKAIEDERQASLAP